MVAASPPTDAKVIAAMFARKILMKKLLLASVFAIASFPGHAKPITQCDIDAGECARIAGETPENDPTGAKLIRRIRIALSPRLHV
jgi:hypothetical protein